MKVTMEVYEAMTVAAKTVLRSPSGSQGNQLVIYKPDEVESAGAIGKKIKQVARAGPVN